MDCTGGYGAAMNAGRLAVAVPLAVVGFVFVGQGLGYIGGSFMTSEPMWAVVGALMLVAAVGLAWSGRRR